MGLAATVVRQPLPAKHLASEWQHQQRDRRNGQGHIHRGHRRYGTLLPRWGRIHYVLLSSEKKEGRAGHEDGTRRKHGTEGHGRGFLQYGYEPALQAVRTWAGSQGARRQEFERPRRIQGAQLEAFEGEPR